MSTPTHFDPLCVQPTDEVVGWRVLRQWRRDAVSVIWSVERGGEHRLLRMALNPRGSPEGPSQERFLEREAGALRRVRHPGILRLHEDGRWPDPVQGFRYLLMDPIEGVDLTVAKRRGMTALQVATVMSRLTQILKALHHEGVFHGLIRPENIILQPNGQVLLVNFILANWPGNPFPPAGNPPPGMEGFEAFFIPLDPDKPFRS
jgi:serine/threonine-protein kinase